MKVLHLSAGNLYGGVETLLTTLARFRHLAPTMEPEYGLCFRGRQWDELGATGVAVHDLGSVRTSRPWTVLRARRRLREVLSTARPDVVVTHSPWSHAVFAPVVRRSACRLVIAVHGPAAGRHWSERWASRTRPDLAIANSRFTAGSVSAVFPGVPVAVWYYAVAEPAASLNRADARGELGTPDDAVVIVQVSRLEEWKGQAVMIDALIGLNGLPDLPRWECWIAGGVQKAGEQAYLSRLVAAARRGGIGDRVRFLGDRSDVPRLLRSADVFCQPNTGPEPFGIVFVEALHAGLPVVTSSFGGAAEIVTEGCGVLAPPGDAAAVADALSHFLRDPERRRKLSVGGPTRARALCDPKRQLTALADHLAGEPVLSLLKPWYVHRPRQIVLGAVRRLHRRPSGEVVLRLPWGADISVDPAETIGRALWTTGLYDIAVSELLYRLTSPGATAVDAGANIGYMTSILAVRAGPAGIVHAFEPHPTIAHKLRDNAARMKTGLPNLAQIEVQQLALSDGSYEARLVCPAEFATNRGTAFLAHGPDGGIRVRARPLDEIIGDGRIDVMKLDVEGHEPAVLRGACRLLADKRARHVVFEAHDGPRGEAGRLLQHAGYALLQIGWRLHGPILIDDHDPPAHRPYEAPSYLATVDRDAAVAACRPRGWRLYGRRARA